MTGNVGMPLQFDIMYDAPLDTRDKIYETMEEANNYLASPTAYAGHIIKVKEDGTINAYIVNEDKTLSPINSGDEVQTLLDSLTWKDL